MACGVVVTCEDLVGLAELEVQGYQVLGFAAQLFGVVLVLVQVRWSLMSMIVGSRAVISWRRLRL